MMSFTDIALIFAIVILPITMIILIAILGKWMMKDKKYLNSSALFVGIPAILCIASYFIVDMIWISSLVSSYPTEAIVLSTSTPLVNNTWWSNHYGDEYNIGDDRYIESFCVPYHQFALVQLQWKCPMMSTCTGSVLAWDCGQRDICQEDCTVNVDDGIEREEYTCDYVNSDDDGADDDNNDDDNNDDDNNNNNNEITEEEMMECANDTFPDNSMVSIITDCSKCIALTATDYKWVKKNEKNKMSSVYEGKKQSVLLASIISLFWGATSLYFYFKQKSEDEQDEKEIHLMDSESTTSTDDNNGDNPTTKVLAA